MDADAHDDGDHTGLPLTHLAATASREDRGRYASQPKLAMDYPYQLVPEKVNVADELPLGYEDHKAFY